MKNGQLQVGQVELGATVNICDEVTAAIVIKAENQLDKIWIDQAVGSYKPPRLPSLELLVGQFTFNHGILATHLISDPLITDDVEFIKPGLALNYSFKKIIPGIGFTIIHTDEDTLEQIQMSNDFACVLNLDYQLSDETLIRLSSLMDSAFIDVDFATTMTLDKFTIDGEVYSKFADWKTTDLFGYFVGFDYELNDHVSLAIRHDGRASNGNATDLDYRFAGGVEIDISHGIFAAAEFAHVTPFEGKSYQEIAIQFGLESTLDLPGFQRKTISNGN
jgi:hypothetical protein